MKVGTDGILIGAWCNCIVDKKVFEIGTGSGLISLMLAQRFPQIKIQAIEINKSAYAEAKLNILNSPWSDRITCLHQDARSFHPDTTFDHIVSNPPFFNNGILPKGKERSAQRHASVSLPFEGILSFAQTYLNERGKLSLILPGNEGRAFIDMAGSSGFSLRRLTYVLPKEMDWPSRILLEFSKNRGITCVDTLPIRGKNNKYSEIYQTMTKEFYLS